MEHGQTLAQAARSGATLTGEFVVDCHMHNARVAKLVVALAFLLVFQHLVGFVYLFELRLITALFVRMVLDR